MGRKYLSLMLVILIPAGVLFGAAAADMKLIEAVNKSDLQNVTALLKQRVNVNAKTPDGTTALHWAVNHDDFAIAVKFIPTH
jgi:ankyrin repeat protein